MVSIKELVIILFPLMSPCNVVSISMVTWSVLLSDFMGKWNYTKFEQRSSSIATYSWSQILESFCFLLCGLCGRRSVAGAPSQVICSLGDVKCF